MELNKLKPCPSCGGKAELDYFYEWIGRNESAHVYFAICTVCGKIGEPVWYKNARTEAERKEMAINAWNGITVEDRIIKALERWAKNFNGRATDLKTLCEATLLIKELAEKNERLRADIAKEFTCVFGQPHKVTDCPIDDEIAKAKADTAREIFKEFDRLMENNEVYFHQTDEMREEFAKIKKKYTEGVE